MIPHFDPIRRFQLALFRSNNFVDSKGLPPLG